MKRKKITMLKYTKIIILIIAVIGFSTKASHAEQIRLVVFGDSLVAGYKLPPDKGFVPVLQNMLNEENYNVEVVDAGVPGDTTTAGKQRLEWAIGNNTHAVILELGANDALRGIKPQNTKQNLSEIIEALKQKNINVLVAGMKAPPNMGQEYETKFNNIYPEIAQQYNVALYPFFLKGVAANPNLNIDDGIHPNEQGIEIIVNNMFGHITKLIKQTKNNQNDS